jgi:CrcB protein
MSAPLWLAVGVLGGVGAIGRFLLDGAISRRAASGFPYGILAVNLSGTFALGLLAGVALDGDAFTLLGAGLLGAYTTFSTWVFDSHRLAQDGRGRWAIANIVASLLLGLAAVWLGRKLGMAIG